MLKDGAIASVVFNSLHEYMSDALGRDERLCKALIPTFPVGCRRLTPGTGYLEALRKPNVRVVTDHIKRVIPEGIETVLGEVIKVDAIVCATGFDVSFTPRIPIIGRRGNLQDIWKRERPQAYMSCAVPGMPNYFRKSSWMIVHAGILLPISLPRAQRPHRPRQCLHNH